LWWHGNGTYNYNYNTMHSLNEPHVALWSNELVHFILVMARLPIRPYNHKVKFEKKSKWIREWDVGLKIVFVFFLFKTIHLLGLSGTQMNEVQKFKPLLNLQKKINSVFIFQNEFVLTYYWVCKQKKNLLLRKCETFKMNIVMERGWNIC
jgi:hypothetical protein